MTDTASPSLADTLDALEGGPTGVTPSAALLLIGHWHTACTTAGLTGVADGLARLRKQLSGRLDGVAIAATLSDLAEGTVAAAQSADVDTAAHLDRLASTLRRFTTVLS